MSETNVTARLDKHSERLDEHSKELLVLRHNQAEQSRQLGDVSRRLYSIQEALFGSANPGEISMKDQLRQTTVLLQDFIMEFRSSQAETQRSRAERLKRISDLENWKDDAVIPHLNESREDKRDWKQFALQGLFWFLTVAGSIIFGKGL